jgi:predicted transcriptional regulator
MVIAKDGSLKTKIMYRANLSFAQLNLYLNFLIRKELLKRHMENGKTFYNTTAKGVKYLESYEKISNLLEMGKENPVRANSPTFWLKRTP